ncbi:hypothetical protein MHC_01320 [Mycoplasma haemocanis str. Illinois]|uniref:Uncharacterized protein n=1 Tax=Mycoplasma haemocanis (strain Illinois) TaxID=1111676 RepID=H6N658_MYCHN|nr:hypothetical protein [Mycoplasma haemocanis]AEW45130.1 hypothetical protein MHC_01320 [Mycoplasma haemocanis str. Illinois]
MGLLGSKAILGLIGAISTVAVGGGYFLFSNGKSLFKKRTGSFCFALPSPGGGFGSCLATFKEEGEFKEYLESRGQKTNYSEEATGLEEVLRQAKKAYEEGLVSFVYLESVNGKGRRWVFPDQESWRKEYSQKT